ncbi:zinc-ribbon domain-containing protein [Oceanibium sediminis]|uniref:zinc-ribbon domain-containing protein n=1 Tax=Oceanibium sediminis TaxID=2026339 RepID=UPI0013005DBC|nr:zinc-ribbon domain-containing protein [Oceanibium sediminis]
MRLVCPSCGSEYEVDGTLFPEEGREVQCSSCEEVWVQYPVKAEAPMRLDLGAQAPAAPSQRLPEQEREELARAVRDELSARDGVASPEPATSYTAPEEDDEDDDEAILAALREQIAAEGPVQQSSDAKSQKRNLRVAAEAVGIDVDAVEDDKERRKWNLDKKPSTPVPGRRDGLAEALQRYEEEVGPRRERSGGGLKTGFIAALVLVAIGAGVFAFRADIAGAYPPAAPYLDQYAELVQQGRVKAEALYAEYSVVVMDKIADLQGGDEAAAESQ